MSQPHLSPYLSFKDGKCAEAMKFYNGILGGKLNLMTFGEAPVESTDKNRDLIMHGALENDTLSFFGSDAMRDNEIIVGNNVQLSINGTDEAKLTEYFNGLAENGEVDHPLKKEFWGDHFGMLTDKYGIRWMINIGEGGK